MNVKKYYLLSFTRNSRRLGFRDLSISLKSFAPAWVASRNGEQTDPLTAFLLVSIQLAVSHLANIRADCMLLLVVVVICWFWMGRRQSTFRSIERPLDWSERKVFARKPGESYQDSMEDHPRRTLEILDCMLRQKHWSHWNASAFIKFIPT